VVLVLKWTEGNPPVRLGDQMTISQADIEPLCQLDSLKLKTVLYWLQS